MRHKAFHKPVLVQLGRIDRDRVVANTRDAATVLLRDWPVHARDPAYQRAQLACLSVIKGECAPYVARNAFIEAARARRVLLAEQL